LRTRYERYKTPLLVCCGAGALILYAKHRLHNRPQATTHTTKSPSTQIKTVTQDERLQDIMRESRAVIPIDKGRERLTLSTGQQLFSIIKHKVAPAFNTKVNIHALPFPEEEEFYYRDTWIFASLIKEEESGDTNTNLVHTSALGYQKLIISETLANLLKTGEALGPTDVPNGDISIIATATRVYKIHLMPLKHMIPEILYQILQQINADQAFKNSIKMLKFNISFPLNPSKVNPEIATIVIYPTLEDHSAQYVLNTIYTLFKEYQGLNITPRWNKKVTDLIYWAQGHGDDKGDEFSFLYTPDRITYRPDLTGTITDYHLKDPARDV